MWTIVETPAGPIRVTARQSAVTAIEFVGEPPEHATPRSSTRVAAERAAARTIGDRVDDDQLLTEAARQLTAYFRRDLKEFDLPLRPEGTPFQRRVWAELQLIGYGETATYGELAERLGMSRGGSRAVGAANGRNPIGIAIPCHRVVGVAGSLSGYAGGVERKQLLLRLEQDGVSGTGSASRASHSKED
jgi:methylated-DNA-[protein]-cysteine S-methyltransferase